MAIQAQFYWDRMENGFGCNELSLNYLPYKQQQQQLQSLPYNSFVPNSTLQNNQFVTLASLIEKHQMEVDHFIRLQYERLILALQEQRKQQLGVILRKIETKTEVWLKQKEEEIAKAVQKRMELEEVMRRIEIENEAWQRVAKEKEAMVCSLNGTIEQLRGSAHYFSSNGAEDAESCCDVVDRHEGEEEDEKKRPKKMVCKSCNSQSSSVIFLPCRHLCSCKACEAFVDSCPVCGGAKRATIEALI